MDERDIREPLMHLLQLEVDAIRAFEQTIAAVGALAARDALGEMRHDHERHAAELGRAVELYGGTAPDTPDLEGRLLALLAALRGAVGTQAALRALLDTERLSTGEYARALAREWPEDLLQIVRHCHSDEHRHLDTIEQWVATRAWEPAAHP